MRKVKALMCDCGCGEPIRCDHCGLPVMENEAHYVVGASIMRGTNDKRGRDVVSGWPLIIRHLRCGVQDIYKSLQVDDPHLEMALLNEN